MDILTGKIVVNLGWSSFNGQFVHPVGRELMGLGGWMEDIVILARFEFHYIREHENLVYNPCNNTFINFHIFNCVILIFQSLTHILFITTFLNAFN